MTSPSPARQALIGAVLVFTAAIAFSSKAVIVKLAYAYPTDPETLLALRMGFSAPFFLGMWLWARSRAGAAFISRGDYGRLLVLGVLGGYLPMWLDFAGLVYVTAGLERVVLFLYPTMVLLLSALLYGQRIGRREVFSLVASYIGVAFAVGHDFSALKSGAGDTALGVMLVLASSFTYAAYLVFSGRLIPRLGSATFTSASMLVASVTASVHFLLTPHKVSVLQLSPPVYGLALLMAVVATVLPALMLSAGIQRIGSSRASLMGAIGPVSTIVLAYIFLGEAITALQLMGTGLVLVGVLAIGSQKA